MLMKETSFRALLLSSSNSKTPLDACTFLYTPTHLVPTSKHTQHMHSHTNKNAQRLSVNYLSTSAAPAAVFLSPTAGKRNHSHWGVLENCVCQQTVNANFTCNGSNIPSLCAILEFLCYSVYSPALDFPLLFG